MKEIAELAVIKLLVNFNKGVDLASSIIVGLSKISIGHSEPLDSTFVANSVQRSFIRQLVWFLLLASTDMHFSQSAATLFSLKGVTGKSA